MQNCIIICRKIAFKSDFHIKNAITYGKFLIAYVILIGNQVMRTKMNLLHVKFLNNLNEAILYTSVTYLWLHFRLNLLKLKDLETTMSYNALLGGV